MKTYLLDTINRIRRFSESLDVQTALCNRPWIVFNDSGEKEVLIFDPDGSVLITVNGVGVRSTWQWIPANKSLIINQHDDTIIMLHPEYYNNSVMALNRDGTQEYAFLIDDNNRNGFPPRTLSELQSYFLSIEEKEKTTIQAQSEKEKKNKYDQEMIEKAKAMDFGFVRISIITIVAVLLITILIICLLITIPNIHPFLAVFLIVLLIAVLLAAMIIPSHLEQKNVNKYIEDNPDDPIVPYLKRLNSKVIR